MDIEGAEKKLGQEAQSIPAAPSSEKPRHRPKQPSVGSSLLSDATSRRSTLNGSSARSSSSTKQGAEEAKRLREASNASFFSKRSWAGSAGPGQFVDDDAAPLILERFYLWETASKFYVQGSDQAGLRHRILKVDKAVDEDGQLIVTQDPAVYTRSQVQTLLEQLRKGNASTGGCTRALECFWGIVGFVRFTGPYYLITIKRRVTVGMIGGHYIYHIEETQLTPMTGDVPKSKAIEEAKLMAAFRSVDLSKYFYYSTGYDLTNTLQSHFTHSSSFSASQSAFTPTPAPSASASPTAAAPTATQDEVTKSQSRKPKGLDRRRAAWGYHDKFLWNHHLLEAAFMDSIDDDKRNPWITPLIYGFVDQSKFCVFGRTVFVLLVARRSRHFAGARFLKRGINDEGYVANEVEIEQIVCEASTTALHIPDPDRRDVPCARKPNPRYASYVQLRGSIPLLWHQDTTHTKAKPPIEFTVADPYFSGAAIHFDDLFTRYGPPVICFNLIKTKERTPREAKLLPEFKQCLDYLAQFLPNPKDLTYLGFDMSAAQRSRQVDVTFYLAGVAEDVIEKTRFFHSGPEPASSLFEKGDELAEAVGELERRERRDTPLLQCGVLRTNCIDCLDRTNAAQFCIGKAMLAHQLHALGILRSRDTPYDSDAVDILTNMYHDLGDTIALQYAGSHLVNTIQTYRKTGNQYKSHARDTLEGLKRYYANTFSDSEKQVSIDLFLGIPPPPSDNEVIAALAETKGKFTASTEEGKLRPPKKTKRRSYRNWFDPDHLVLPPPPDEAKALLDRVAAVRGEDGYFNLYYRPWLWTAMEQHFGTRMNSSVFFVPKEIPSMSDKDFEEVLSPFRKRENPNEKKTFEAHRPHGRASVSGPPGGVANVARWLSNRAVEGTAGRVTEAQKAAQRRRLSRIPSEAVSNSVRNDRGQGTDESDSAEDEEIVRVVKGTLNPTLKESEMMEYDQYIHQFDALKLLETHYSLANMSDLPIYERSIQLSPSRSADRHGSSGYAGGISTGSGESPAFARLMRDDGGVEAKDIRVYADAVKVASGTAWPAASTTGGIGGGVQFNLTSRRTKPLAGSGTVTLPPLSKPASLFAHEGAGTSTPKVRLAPPPSEAAAPALTTTAGVSMDHVAGGREAAGMGLGLALGLPAGR